MSSPHPLDPAAAAEYLAGRDVMVAAGLLAAPVRFAYYGLEEPPKDEVLAGPEAADRRLRAFLVNTGTGESTDVVVSLTHGKVVSARTLDPGTDGQLPILDSDFAAVDEITKADPEWRAAMARRGYHDVSTIRTCPITAGAFGSPDDNRQKDGPGARLRPGRRARPGLGAPCRRRRRLRGPDREEGLQGHRRVRAPGARARTATTTTRPSAARTAPRCGPSRSPSRRGRASPSTGTRCAGRTGRCGSASTPARG